MKDLLVRNLPDDLIDALDQAARVEGHSRQEYIHWLLSLMVGSEWTFLESLDDCEDALDDERTQIYAIQAARRVR